MNVIDTLLGLLNGKHADPQPVRMNFTGNDQHYYSPSQIKAAEQKVGPGPIITPAGKYGGWQIPLRPNPAAGPNPGAYYQPKINQALQATPKQPNFEGATPPAMVNVSWSAKPVPYSQSLNGPPGGK